MTVLLIITLISLKAGVPDQRQEIPHVSLEECEKGKKRFFKMFNRYANANWEPTAECVERPVKKRGKK